MANIFDDLFPTQQEGGGTADDIFADLAAPKNYTPPPLPPVRPPQAEILDALGITAPAPEKPVSIEQALAGFDARLKPTETPAPVPPDAGAFASLKPENPAGLPATAPLMPRRPDQLPPGAIATGEDAPMPPRRPDALPLEGAPLPPPKPTGFNPADTTGLSLELPSDYKMRDAKGSQGNPTLLGDTNMSIEESAKAVNDGIKAAEKVAEETAERLRQARERFKRIEDGLGGRTPRPGSGTALQFNTAKQQLEKEELAHAAAIDTLGKARTAQGPSLHPHADAARRGVEALATMPFDAAAGAMRIPDAILGTKYQSLASGPAKISKYISDNIAEDPTRNEQLIAGLGQGGGSLVGFIAGGAGLRALGLSQAVASSILGGFQNAETNYRDAEALGKKGFDLAKSYAAGFVTGGSEGVLGTGKILDSLNKATQGGVWRYLGTIIQEKGEEGLQEGVQTLMQNLHDQKLLGKEGNLEDGVGHAALIGAILGGGTAALLHAPQLARDLAMPKVPELDPETQAAIMRELQIGPAPIVSQEGSTNVQAPRPAGAGGPPAGGGAQSAPLAAETAPAPTPGSGPGESANGAPAAGNDEGTGLPQPPVRNVGTPEGEPAGELPPPRPDALGDEALSEGPLPSGGNAPSAQVPENAASAPEQSGTPSAETPARSADEADLRLLLGDGWDLETAQDIMRSSGERRQAIREARERGVEPVEGPIPGYQPAAESSEGNVSHETTAPQASQRTGGDPSSKAAPSVASDPASQEDPTPSLPSSGGRGEGATSTAPVGSSPTPVPANAAELRDRLPKDATGSADWGALESATEAVTGKKQPWGRLGADEKQAVWDRLNGAAKVENQGNATGTGAAIPVDSGDKRSLDKLPDSVLAGITSAIYDATPNPETGATRVLMTDDERQALRDHGIEVDDNGIIAGDSVSTLMDERGRRNGTGGRKEGFEAPQESEESKDRNSRRKTLNDLAARWDALGEPDKAKALRDLRSNPPQVHDLLEHKLQVEAAERRKAHSDRRGQEGATTTPGTRISWSNLGEWTNGAHELNRRAHSTPRFQQEQAHLEELAKRPDIIKNASADELRDLIDALDGRIHTLSKPKPSAAGTTWEKVNQLARDRLAQLEQGRADKPKTPRQDKRQPSNLLELIAKNGGLEPSTELKMRDLHNHFLPGWGRLVRKGGMHLDKARELANEHGYMRDGSVDDLLNLIEDEAHRKIRAKTEREQNYDDTPEQDPAEREMEIADAIRDALDEMGLGSQIDEEAMSLAVDMVMRGESDLINAYEQAIMRLEAQDPEVAAEFAEADIPFDGAHDEEAIGGTEPEGRDDLEEPRDASEEDGSEESGDDSEAGQRPAADRGREDEDGEDDGDWSDIGSGSERDPGTRAGQVSESELLDALERIEKGENIEDGALRKRLVDEKYVKGATKLKLAKAGQQALETHKRRRADKLALDAELATYPDTIEGLIEESLKLIDPYNDAVVKGDEKTAKKLRDKLWKMELKANSLREDYDAGEKYQFGIATDESPAQLLRDAKMAKPGTVPKWGQSGAFVMNVDGTEYLITHGGSLSAAIHATDITKPFPSQTGYHSMLGGGRLFGDNADEGRTVKQHWEASIRYLTKGNGKTGTQGTKPAEMHLPRTAYRVRRLDEMDFEGRRDRGVIAHQGYMRSYDLLKNKDPENGAPEATLNKAEFKEKLARDDRGQDVPYSTVVGPNGAEYWIGYNTLRDPDTGLTADDQLTLYKRVGDDIEILAQKEVEFKDRFDRADMVEQGLEDAFDGYEDGPASIPTVEEIRKKLSPHYSGKINGIKFQIAKAHGEKGRLGVSAEWKGNRNSDVQGTAESNAKFLDRAASWIHSQLQRARQESLPPGSGSKLPQHSIEDQIEAIEAALKRGSTPPWTVGQNLYSAKYDGPIRITKEAFDAWTAKTGKRAYGGQQITEKGADGKPQTIIAGTEHDVKGATQIKADAPLKPKAPQRPMEEGLFGDGHKQGDLLDGIKAPGPKQEDLTHIGSGPLQLPEASKIDARVSKLKDQLVVFASGMSRIGDLKAGSFTVGGMQSRGVGVEVNELSKPAIATLANAVVNLQTQVFVDSGAFGIFKRNLRNQAQARKEAEDMFAQAGQKPPAQWQVLSFDAILDTYDVIQEKIAEKYDEEGEPDYPRPLFVMPDIVGDQAGSLELVEKYAKRIQVEAEWNLSKPIVPIQKGELSMADAYFKVVSILGTENFIVGVPSNAKALSNEELTEFLKEAKPLGLHFLGAAAEKTLDGKLRAIAEAGVDLEHLSADGNILRGSLYGQEPTGMDRPTAVSETLQTKSPEAFEGQTLAEVLGAKVREGTVPNILQARKIAKAMGEEDPKKVEEALEFGVVLEARRLAKAYGHNPKVLFEKLVKLYANQPNLGTRTSTSMLNQAYSTPIPLAYLASRLADIGPGNTVYEPTAGNGALVIEALPALTLTNEINPERRKNLEEQGFKVHGEDASEWSPRIGNRDVSGFERVISNPPFGVVKDEIGESQEFDLTDIQKGYRTKEIDHAIALRALETMAPNGRAVLIIGSVNPQKDRSQGYRGKAKNEFFLTLLKNYNVTQHFTVDGSLYKKQGAGWPVDVIVIEGRGTSSLEHPAKTVPPVLTSWEEVGAKLDGIRGSEGQSSGHGTVSADAGTGRGGSVDGVRGDTGSSGESSVEPALDGGPGQVSEAHDPAQSQSGDRGGRGGRSGGSRGSKGSSGASVDALSALEAAIAAHYGEEKAPAASPKAEEARKFRTQIQNTGEAWTTRDDGREIYWQIREVQGRFHTHATGAGTDTGSQAFMSRDAAVEDAVRRAFGNDHAKKPESGAVRVFRMNVNDAADFAFGRNGIKKNPDAAIRYYENAERYLNEDSEGDPEYIEAVRDDIPLLKKTAKSLGREPKIPAALRTRAKPAKAAVVEVAQGIREAGEGLFTMFGGSSSKLNSGFTFDEDTYAKALPHFRKAIAHLKNAAANVAKVADELIGFMKNTLGAPVEMVRKMLPYLQRFITDVQNGTLPQERTTEDQDLENAPEAFQGNAQQATDLDETANQVTYRPRSGVFGLGTLVPTNMRNATEVALEALENRVGNLEQFVGTKLGYKTDDKGPYFIRNGQKERPFAAEQIDALALAIDNMGRGAALVIGDQTGIGKGRVNAGILRYAMESKAVPIFVTKDPGLYKDIYRDLTDIGIQEYLGREPNLLMTDAGKTVPLDEDERMVLKTPTLASHDKTLAKIAKDGNLGQHDVLLTSYSQMQTVKGQETQRMRTLQAIASNAILALDESHNAGGGDIDAEAKFEAKRRAWEKKRDKARRQGKPFNIPEPVMLPDRAQLARMLVDQARAAFYSSATYAKRPEVMDLYRKTDMRFAVENINELAAAISEGGVPMQQVVASMLARAGQYVRRERSFAGVTYEPRVVDVDEDLYDSFSSALAQIQEFSKLVAEVTAGIDEDLKGSGSKVGHDNATGKAGADSMQFTSIMHNLVGQMLLSINAKPAAEAAIAAVKRGEKPLIALANTNESFLSDFAKEAGLKVGDAIDLDMSAMLARYLERTRWISVREPFMEEGEEAEKRRLTDEEIGSEGVELFESVKAYLDGTDFSGLPASPVDYIKGELAKAGVRVGEITGRTLTIDYTGDKPRLANRSGEERTTRGKNKTMGGFNGGEIDALILNQSGSTGFSMHASAKFKDQKPRVMIIAQAEANVDTHMQMLGRIHRTGQVRLPSYLQMIPNIPAAKRPAAILLKKMASLNANTTANRSSALTADGVVDFMNEYGDNVAARVMLDDPELNERMDYPVDPEAKNVDGFMRKLTGRIPLLPVQEQKDLYEKIEQTYNAYLEQLEAEGRNTLEAKTLELDAVPLRTITAMDATRPNNAALDSPFTEAVYMTEYDVEKQGRPYQIADLLQDLRDSLDRQDLPADPVRALTEADATGEVEMIERAQEARAGFTTFKQRFLAKIKDADKLQKHTNRLQEEENTFTELTKLVYPGARIRMKFADDESLSGIVIKISQPREGAPNPMAAGAWKAKVAVPTGARSYEIPFTRFVMGKDPEGDQIAVETAGWSEPVEATVKLFELAATATSRETRVIATGNLLKAFTTVAKHGNIINFKTRDGQTVPGILLREKVKTLAKALEGKKVDLTIDQAIAQLASAPLEQIQTSDGYLTVINTGRGYYQLHANKAKDKGGKYFLNKPLLEVLGKDFYSQGSTMRVDVADAKLPSVLAAIIAAKGKFTTGTELDESAVTTHPGAAPVQNQTRAAGLYSATLRAAENAKIKKGTGQQWLATLLNTPGVKADEIAWIGLDTWLAGKKAVTRDEVVDFIRQNQIEVREITKGANPVTDAEIQAKAKELYEEELSLMVDDHMERFGDNSESWFAEAVEEEDEDSDGWEGTGFDEDEMGDDLYSLTGEERPTRWTYVLHGSDGEPEANWRTFASEDEALKAGEIEAERRNTSQFEDIKTEIANNRMRGWDQFEKEAQEALEEERGDQQVTYGSYQLPNGENYREILLTLPTRREGPNVGPAGWAEVGNSNARAGSNNYHSSHWEEKNVLVHVRVNERVIDDQRTLFVEEIQSDWHQAGRKRGYKGDPADAAIEAEWLEADAEFLRAATAYNEAEEEYNRYEPHSPEARAQRRVVNSARDWYEAASARMNAADEARGGGDKVPNAPFKKDWHELALKRIIRMAVDEGFDQIAWTSGHIQNTRYDLAKHFDSISVQHTSGGIGIPQDLPFTQGSFVAHDRNGKEVHRQSIWDVAQLEELIGKELAAKLIAQPSRTGNYSGLGMRIWELQGVDLQVGGSGMTGFYDRILPMAADKLGKRFGTRTWKDGGRVLVDYYEDSNLFNTAEEFESEDGRVIWTDAHSARNSEHKASFPVHVFPIPATMKLAATVDGFPLFHLRASPEGQAQMEAARQALLTEIKQRVIGDHVGIRFATPSSTAESRAASLGQRDAATAEVVGAYTDRLMTIALTGDAESIYHEAFHGFQHLGGFTAQEVALLERERPRNRAYVAKHYGPIDDDAEIDAYAAGLYGAAMDQDAPGKAVGLHVGLRRAFERFRQFVRRVMNLLRGHGYQISEDIFERARSGELRSRLDAGRGIGQGGVGYGPVWDWQVARNAADMTARQGMAPAQNQTKGTFSQGTVDEVAALNAAHGSPTPTAPAPAPTFNTPVETFVDRARAYHQDAFRMLEKVQGAIEEHRGARLPEPSDAYVAQIVYPGRRDERLHDFKRDHVDPLVKEIENAKVSTDDIGLYLIAKHARERNAEMAMRDPNRFGMDNGSGMAGDTADHYIQRFIAEGKEPALERIAQRVYAILDFDRTTRHNAGLISDDTLNHWTGLFPSGRYVPLRGFAERDEDFDGNGSRFGQGFNIRGREAIPATGRFTLSDNPLYASVAMAYEGIVRAEKNVAGKSLLRLVRNNQNPDLWELVRSPTMKAIHPTTGLVRDVPDPRYLNDPNVIGVKVGGVPYFIELKNGNLALAYRNMGVPGFTKTTQFFAKWTRIYSSLQTSRNPEFFIPNAIRDVQEAVISLEALDPKLVRPFLKNLPAAYMAAWKKVRGKSAGPVWDQIYDDWRLDGGRISHFGMSGIDQIATEVEAELKRATWGWGKAMPYKAVRLVVKLFDAMNEIFENATRMAVYKAARENGYGNQRKRAAGLSREATVNFTKRGHSSAWMNAYWAFYNASVQGNAKQLVYLKRSKRMRYIFAGALGMGFMMGMLSRFAFGDDDDDPEGKRPWDFVPDYDKRAYLVIPYGTEKDAQGNTRLSYGKIPLAFGLRIPYYAGLQVADVLFGKKDPLKAAGETFLNTLDAFNPIGDGQLLTMIFPTLTKPIPELFTNSNWLGRNIYPEKERWNEGLPRASQPTNASTPKWAVSTTEMLNSMTGGDKFNSGYADIYPGVVDYAAGWLTGGLGRFIGNSIEAGSNLAQGGETPIERWPMARRFMGETNGAGEGNLYYEGRKEAGEHKNRFNAAKRAVAENPDDEEAWKTLEREAEWLNVSPSPTKKTQWKGSTSRQYEDTDDYIKGLREKRQDILNDKGTPLAERQRQVKDIESEIWKTQRDTRAAVKDMTKPQPAPAAAPKVSEPRLEETGPKVPRKEGIMDWLFGSSGTKMIEAEKGQPFPTNEDLSFARKSGVFYGRDEAFLNGDRARFYGTVEKTTVPPPKGAKKGTKPTVLETFRAQATPDGKLTPILESLSDPRRTSIQPVMDPALKDDLGKAALAANRTALSTLGYKPRRTTLDTQSGPSTIGGAYLPETDEGLILTQGNPSTPTHEALHRGIDRVRQARPDLFQGFSVDEETLVRQIMRTKMGNPEQGKGEIADKQLERSKWHFEGSTYAKGNQKRLDEIEAAAAELIRQDRPRGGPR